MADLSLRDKFKAYVFRWLDSYAGLNLIRFNGTHVQTCVAITQNLHNLSELLLALRQAIYRLTCFRLGGIVNLYLYKLHLYGSHDRLQCSMENLILIAARVVHESSDNLIFYRHSYQLNLF